MDFDPHLTKNRPNGAKPSPNEPVTLGAPLSPARPRQLAASGASLGGLGAQSGHHHHAQDQDGTSEYDHDHDQDHSSGEQDGLAGDGSDPKKPRACEACRGLKVRCDPDPDNHDGPCKRCKKAGRKCVVTVPTRKRQKRTDSRVAELEKKIDALTASLQARVPQHMQGQGQQSPTTGSVSAPGSISYAMHRSPTVRSSRTPPIVHRASAPGDESTNPGCGMDWNPPLPRVRNAATLPIMQQSRYSPARDHPSNFLPTVSLAGQKRKGSGQLEPGEEGRGSPAAAAPPVSSLFAKQAEGDIVDRGLITMDLVDEIFARYTDQMVPEMPAVIFPPGTTASEIRKTQPVLFLSIMAAASGDYPKLQRTLQREMMYVFAEKIFLAGEKSIELIQAIHVSVVWYWPPEHFEELKFYQLTHMAAVMAIDIGLGKRGPQRRILPPFSTKEGAQRRAPPDPMTIENRRTWLACHYLCANTSMAMHRPNLLRWTPFMSDCVEVLMSSPDAALTDKYFCHLVWSHRHAEEIALQFAMDDSSVGVNITELRTQHALKALQREMDKYRASVPREEMKPTLEIGFNVVTLFMNELAIHSDSSNDQWRPPFNTDNLQEGIVQSETLSTAHINALSACLAASTSILDLFISMPIPRVRSLPVFNFVRVAFALVIRLKMWFTAASPRLDLGNVIERDSLRAEYYIETLLNKFRAAAAEEKCRSAVKFLVVLSMLRTWFFRRGKADGGAAGPGPGQAGAEMTPQRSGSCPVDAVSQQQKPRVNTPLQLLSEVATVGEPTGARTSMYNKTPGVPHPPQSSFQESPSAANTPPPGRFPPQLPLSGPALGHMASTNGSESTDSLSGPQAPGFQSSASSWVPSQPGPAAADFGGAMDLQGLDDMGIGLDSVDLNPNSFPMFFMNDAWPDLEGIMQNMPDPNQFPF